MKQHNKISVLTMILFLVCFNSLSAGQCFYQQSFGMMYSAQNWARQNPKTVVAGVVVLTCAAAGLAKIKYDRAIKKIFFDLFVAQGIPVEKQKEIAAAAEEKVSQFRINSDTEYANALDDKLKVSNEVQVIRNELNRIYLTLDQLRLLSQEEFYNIVLTWTTKRDELELKEVELVQAQEKLETLFQVARDKSKKALQQATELQQALGIKPWVLFLLGGEQLDVACKQYKYAMMRLYSAFHILKERGIVGEGECCICQEESPLIAKANKTSNKICVPCWFDIALNKEKPQDMLVRGLSDVTSWQEVVAATVSYKPME